jgi:flagellar biosynthetic protein FliP
MNEETRIEEKMNTDNTRSNETPTFAATSEAAGSAATASAETGEPAGFRSRLGSGLRFARHLLEMVLAMMVGMGVFGLALWSLGEPPGYANLLVEYGLMGAFMAAPMVAWMRYRGHSWSDGAEMTGAMVVPMLALAAPVELGVAVTGLYEGSLMMLSHVAMVGGMVALMLYRFERYAHGSHDRGA